MAGMMARGNPNLMKAIKEGAAKVSEQNGIRTPNITQPTPQGGAAYSVQRQQNLQGMSSIQEMFGPVSNKVSTAKTATFDFEKSMSSRIIESLETLAVSKEYFNALQSLITLYASGNLTEGVMRKLTQEDLNEIKGILKEFSSVLNSF